MATLLIVEDEEEVVNYLKDFFQQHELEVLTASTGEEGLELLSSKNPSLVLLDMKLGSGISGMEVLRRGKADYPQIEFIVVTAVDDHNVADMAKGLGARDYITKPFNILELERVVLPRLKG